MRLNHSWLAIPRLLQTCISQGGPKLARGTSFGCQNWFGQTDFGSKTGPEGPVLANVSAKIGLAGPILGGTDFGMTGHYLFKFQIP